MALCLMEGIFQVKLPETFFLSFCFSKFLYAYQNIEKYHLIHPLKLQLPYAIISKLKTLLNSYFSVKVNPTKDGTKPSPIISDWYLPLRS